MCDMRRYFKLALGEEMQKNDGSTARIDEKRRIIGILKLLRGAWRDFKFSTNDKSTARIDDKRRIKGKLKLLCDSWRDFKIVPHEEAKKIIDQQLRLTTEEELHAVWISHVDCE